MRARFVLSAAALLLAALPISGAHATPSPIAGCAASAPGGDWLGYGGDLMNSRSQPLETTINAGRAPNLARAWAFATTSIPQRGGAIQSTPVVTMGCVFVTSGGGAVFMLNADTGVPVWSVRLPGQGSSLAAEIITGSPAVGPDGTVYVAVSNPGRSKVVALDAHAGGAILWERIVDVTAGHFIAASPVLYDGMIFQGFSGPEAGDGVIAQQPGTNTARGGWSIIDAARTCSADSATTCATPVNGATGGSILARDYTIDDEAFNDGERGASVWCTAAIDVVDKYAYACGGNPANKKFETRNANSLLKIDIDRARPTFGKLVDSYKGQTEQYYPGLERQPACDHLGSQVWLIWSQPCLQMDLDFGSSPNLWRTPRGELMVGDLQKSGVYHAVWADHMQAAWSTVVGVPCFPCNASSAAVGPNGIYVASSPGPVMWGLARSNGSPQWALPLVPGGTHFQSVSVANGLVYSVTNGGVLHMIEASTGLLVAARQIGQDAGVAQDAVSAGSAGVAIARNTVFAPSGSVLVAYR